MVFSFSEKVREKNDIRTFPERFTGNRYIRKHRNPEIPGGGTGWKWEGKEVHVKKKCKKEKPPNSKKWVCMKYKIVVYVVIHWQHSQSIFWPATGINKQILSVLKSTNNTHPYKILQKSILSLCLRSYASIFDIYNPLLSTVHG